MIQGCADGINVDARLGIAGIQYLLGCHERERSEHLPIAGHPGEAGILEILGEPKVRRDGQIFRPSSVTRILSGLMSRWMTRRLCVRQPIEHLAGDCTGDTDPIGRRQPSQQGRRQVDGRDVVHREVELALRHPHFVEPYDPRVVQPAQDAELPQEKPHGGLVGGRLGQDDFQREFALGGELPREVDGPHSSATQKATDLEAWDLEYRPAALGLTRPAGSPPDRRRSASVSPGERRSSRRFRRGLRRRGRISG